MEKQAIPEGNVAKASDSANNTSRNLLKGCNHVNIKGFQSFIAALLVLANDYNVYV